ncbi:hypothetical protein [Paenibacillus etheri]|uniref:Uncharacterized protein n=1 Tax=Paenibacillus etheri TaxID=1306852 RepID=A0A0W1B543_9BACL|nr:hypothetical protein [Paenibacillus etheri]KTD88691.1 hypothetical protein UQ64_03700 [Paenibacillus etheri]
MQVRLESFDIKRIKEIAVLEGLDPESFETEIWSIVSAALVTFRRNLMEAQRQQIPSTKSEDD